MRAAAYIRVSTEKQAAEEVRVSHAPTSAKDQRRRWRRLVELLLGAEEEAEGDQPC